MKKIIIIIFAIVLSLTGFSQGVRHSQLAPIQPTLADSLLMYIYSPDGNWSIGKRAFSDLSIDTTQIDGLDDFARKTWVTDKNYLINSDLSGLRDSTSANTGKDTTGIYHANRALLDAIDVNDTTRWGEQPEFLTDLDSANFDIDTTQVRNLKTFVENNSGEASISGTENYIPKFGASGLTESNVYEDGSGNIGIGTTTPRSLFDVAASSIIANTDIRTDGGLILNDRGTGNRYAFIDFKGDDTYKSPLRIIRYNTGANANSAITHRGLGSLRLITNEAAPIQFHTNTTERMRITSDGKVGIGTKVPSEKLEVNGNIKADTGKFDEVYLGAYSIRDTSHIDRANWIEFVGNWSGAGGSMVYPGAGIPVSTGSAWGTSITPPTSGAYLNYMYYDWIGQKWGWFPLYEWRLLVNGTSAGLIDNTSTSGINLIAGTGVALNTSTTITGYRNVTISATGGGGEQGDVTSVTAGNGLTGSGTTGDVTLTLGTPSSLTSTSTNSVTSNSHTHQIASGAIKGAMLNNTVISDRAAITSGLTSTHELLVSSNSGALNRMDISVLQTYMQNNLSFGGGTGDNNYTTAVTLSGTNLITSRNGLTDITTDLSSLSGGGSMVYPGAGIPVSTGSAWGTSKASPTGAIVGTTDSQALTNKSVNGVTLSTSAGTTNFLAGDGTYKAAGGIGSSSSGELLFNNSGILDGLFKVKMIGGGASFKIGDESTYFESNIVKPLIMLDNGNNSKVWIINANYQKTSATTTYNYLNNELLPTNSIVSGVLKTTFYNKTDNKVVYQEIWCKVQNNSGTYSISSTELNRTGDIGTEYDLYSVTLHASPTSFLSIKSGAFNLDNDIINMSIIAELSLIKY